MRFALLIAPAIAWMLIDATSAVRGQGVGLLVAQPSAVGEMPLTLTQPEPYQPYQKHPPGGAHPLAPDEVAQSLLHRGFSDVSVIRQRGQAYLCEATGPRGERVRLVVDAASGDISGMQVIGYRGH